MYVKIFLLLFFTTPLVALYNGNPSLPDMPEQGLFTRGDQCFGVKLGYELDATFSKRVKFDVEQQGSKIKDLLDTYHSTKQLGVITFNLIDRFEIYTLLGSMKLKMSQRPFKGSYVEYETDNELIWGVGGRVVLVYWDEVILGVNARYNGSHLDLSRLTINGTPLATSDAKMEYHEWQVGMSFSREIGPFIPYLGVAYASMHSDLKNLPIFANAERIELKNRNPFLLLLGVGMTSGKVMNLNLEVRMLGERALTASMDFRF